MVILWVVLKFVVGSVIVPCLSKTPPLSSNFQTSGSLSNKQDTQIPGPKLQNLIQRVLFKLPTPAISINCHWNQLSDPVGSEAGGSNKFPKEHLLQPPGRVTEKSQGSWDVGRRGEGLWARTERPTRRCLVLEQVRRQWRWDGAIFSISIQCHLALLEKELDFQVPQVKLTSSSATY